MEYRREKWKGHGPTLFHIILFHSLMAMVHGTCGPLPTLSYAVPSLSSEVSSETQFEDGAQIKYICRKGYSRNSSNTVLTCKENSWYPTSPFCVKKRCRHPGELNNGKVIITTDLEFGSKIEFSCSEGYNLIGSPTSYCEIYDSSVTWSEPLPICEIIRCPLPPLISNGKHNGREDSYTFGSSVTYSCNTPYSLIGEASLSCTVANETVGIWSPQPPTCKMVTCTQPQVLNGTITSGFGIIYTYKDTILFECNKGYNLNGTNLVQCGADNQWHPDIPTCVINSCIGQPVINNAELKSHPKHEDVFSAGTVLTFACKHGYKIIPEITFNATCQEDFSWHVNRELCKRICCPTPRITNGKISFTEDCKYKPSSTFTQNCNSYYSTKQQRSICQSDGTWKPEITICEEERNSDCNSPKRIENGKYELKSGYTGVKAYYSCDDGYKLFGMSEISCHYSRWSHPFPSCQALCSKPEVANGKLLPEKNQYVSSDSINIQCSPGYNLTGPQIITCSDDGVWTPAVPKCNWEFHEYCDKVSAGYHLMQCLPNPQDVKIALEIYKLSLEIEALELERDMKTGTKSESSPLYSHSMKREVMFDKS